MKIKLVTFAPHPNYGTCLQSYALNKVLRDMGHDVEFIYNGRENPPIPISQYIKDFIKFFLPKVILQTIKKNKSQADQIKNQTPPILELPNNYLLYCLSLLPGYKVFYKSYKCRNSQFAKIYSFTFEDGNYKMKRLYVRKQYKEVTNDADLFITGSDQIWNPYCGGFNPMMFLEFAGNKKRISYSSSIARPKFPEEIEKRALEDLNKFQHIAVREQTSVDMLNSLLRRTDVKLVVDPTILLSTSDWVEFAERAKIEISIPPKFILCYFIGDERTEEYKHLVEKVKKDTGISRVITINCTTNNTNVGGDIFYKEGGPYEFVYLILHASFICVDSFHATIMALKLGKDFVHILKSNDESDVNSQNTRIYDIFKRYNIMNKLYDLSHNYLAPIDFNSVSDVMNNEIKESLDYLRCAINS